MFFYVNCHLISKLQVLGNHGEKVLEPALKKGWQSETNKCHPKREDFNTSVT